MTLAQLKEQQVDKLLQEIADRQTRVRVLLPDGKEIVIEPVHPLEPLPELKGYVPDGWKDSLYA
jgi:hypothetical protein